MNLIDIVTYFFSPFASFAAVINVTISPVYQEVQETATQVTFTVSRNDDLTLDRNVIVIVSAIADTAVAGILSLSLSLSLALSLSVSFC